MAHGKRAGRRDVAGAVVAAVDRQAWGGGRAAAKKARGVGAGQAPAGPLYGPMQLVEDRTEADGDVEDGREIETAGAQHSREGTEAPVFEHKARSGDLANEIVSARDSRD